MKLPKLNGHPFLRPGAMPAVDDREWQDPERSPWLRVVLLMTDLMYRSHGVTAQVRLSGQELPFCAKVAADVSLAGIQPFEAAKIAEAINVNFPFGQGNLETATVKGDCLRITVPTNGYSKVANVLAEWPKFGATGEEHGATSPNSLVAHSPVRRIRQDQIARRIHEPRKF